MRLLDGSGVNREVHAPFCERLGVRFPRPTCHRLHWCLDVQFNDDQSRARSGHAANNLAVVRHIVMNLLRLDTTRKASIKSKRMLAATVDHYRAELLGVMT